MFLNAYSRALKYYYQRLKHYESLQSVTLETDRLLAGDCVIYPSLPLLTGKTDPRFHKPFVRSEYFDALKENDGTRATMYRDDRYKLVVYHGHDLGELYDLNVDPGEFNDLWDDPNASDIKNRLIHQSFDATMLVQDLGPPRIGPM